MPQGELLGVDFGQRRVGLARATAEGGIATAWRTLEVRGREHAIDQLEQIVSDAGYAVVVFGLPLGADGEAGDMARRVRRVAAALTARTGVRCEFEDEWGTSLEAKRVAARSPRDAVAAALILQAYLDRCGSES